LEKGNYNGLKPTHTTFEITKHIFEGAKESKILNLPDLRQQMLEPHKRNGDDIMNLYLFPL
jgi:hypothetical protein